MDMPERKVRLKTSDGALFEVRQSTANEMWTLKNLIERTGGNKVITVPTVSSTILNKVIVYCHYHQECRKRSDAKPAVVEADMRRWDADFIDVDTLTLFDLLMAAKILNVENLHSLTSRAMDIRSKFTGERKIIKKGD